MEENFDNISMGKFIWCKVSTPEDITQYHQRYAKRLNRKKEIRWIVESSNARIKTWKYLSHTLPTNQIPFIGDFVRIVCALSNKYAPPLSQCRDVESDQLEAAKMVRLSKMSNTLNEHVETENLLKKKLIWKVASEYDLENFPRLDDEELRNITCGVYRMKLATSYIQEYTDEESDIFDHREDSNLLRVKIQSRHTSSKKHQLWIRYNESYIDSWYCLCRDGARVVGSCSHVAAVLWYLGKKLYKDKSVSYGVRNWGEHVLDASVLPELIDGSDSQSDASVVEE
ncbi:unnamed protein product [Mytilus coruscus]|uniref:Uncharacterized protein n=1 Tax=Mytilus coruscus TaxID=42192 RepID=A0A6J8C8E9_MYTCO|nr:unnamed protein product [Mytilus coruscus]